MRIELVIDDLLLYGFDPRDGHRFGDAFTGALESSVAGWTRRAVGSRDEVRLTVPLSAASREIGPISAAVARAIAGAISQPERTP
jgi:hypothetical protein